MTLAELLTSQRRWGRTRARKFLMRRRPQREQAARHPDSAPAGAARDRPRRQGRRARTPAAVPSSGGARRRPERESSRGALEGAPQHQEGGHEGDRPDRQADREHEPRGIEEDADDEDEDRAGEQRRVGAVAGEVLAHRDLEAAEAGEHDADADRGRAAAEEADHEHDDAGEDRKLGERERAPRRRGPLVAGCRLHKGQPEETFTRHQPISIPIRPRRGRECQWPQPGSPTSAREIRSHLNSAGRRACRSSSSRLPLSSSSRSRERRAGVADRARRARPAPARARPGRGHAASAATAATPTSISTRGKASAKRRASSCSRRPIWRRSSTRARRSSPPTWRRPGASLSEQFRHCPSRV